MIKVDVFVKEKKWKKYFLDPKKYVNKKIKEVKKLFPLFKNKKIKFTILLTNSQEIRKFNKKFRNKNKSTDVLSFPFYIEKDLKKKLIQNNNIYLGDIILNFNKISKISKKIFISHFNKLLIHGFLHLLGYKHFKNKDFKKMQNLEIKLVNKIEN